MYAAKGDSIAVADDDDDDDEEEEEEEEDEEDDEEEGEAEEEEEEKKLNRGVGVGGHDRCGGSWAINCVTDKDAAFLPMSVILSVTLVVGLLSELLE